MKVINLTSRTLSSTITGKELKPSRIILRTNVRNKVLKKYDDLNNDWLLDIHDAVLCSPGLVVRVRETAVERLQCYRDSRQKILTNYMKSIGATISGADLQFMEHTQTIQNAGKAELKRTLIK